MVMVLVDVRDPGNAGTMIRTADAAGVDGIVHCDGTVDPTNPKTVRSSAGSIFHVPVVSGGGRPLMASLRGWGFADRGHRCFPGVRLRRFDWGRRLALVFGNEAAGLDGALDDRSTSGSPSPWWPGRVAQRGGVGVGALLRSAPSPAFGYPVTGPRPRTTAGSGLVLRSRAWMRLGGIEGAGVTDRTRAAPPPSARRGPHSGAMPTMSDPPTWTSWSVRPRRPWPGPPRPRTSAWWRPPHRQEVGTGPGQPEPRRPRARRPQGAGPEAQRGSSAIER